MITIPILFSLLFLYLAFGPFKKKEKRYIGDYGFIGGGRRLIRVAIKTPLVNTFFIDLGSLFGN